MDTLGKEYKKKLISVRCYVGTATRYAPINNLIIGRI
jgi:hypothetical protein